MHTNIALRPFQETFLAESTCPSIDTAAISLPRGNGKSFLAGRLISKILTPQDSLFVPGTESVLCAASIEQARIVYRFARLELEDNPAYKFLDSANRISILHKSTNTRLRIIGSNGKTAMGLVGCPWVVADEPAAWEVVGGGLVHDAIETAKGKPGSALRSLYLGTLAPSLSGWWHDLIDDGSHGSTYVQALRGNPEKWDQWGEIRRVNPLVAVSPEFRKKLLQERDEARRDTRLKARFFSYRLNIPSADESTMLLTVDDWKKVCAREVPERKGRPIVGLDLGGGWAWSSAVACFPNGRIEAIAIAPGLPSIETQEKRDRVPAGTYRKLIQSGALRISEGLRVQPPKMLVDFIRERWGTPEFIICDRFKLAELKDSASSLKVVSRVTRWSEASFDIAATRKYAKDGPLSCEESSRLLLTFSLSIAMVKNDDQGGTRIRKRDQSNNQSRDDVAAALVLALGALRRREQSKARGGGWSHAVAA